MADQKTATFDTIDIDECGDDCSPTGSGILKCLTMLAEEAAALQLPRTLAALRRAMEACISEEAPDLETAFATLQRAEGAPLN